MSYKSNKVTEAIDLVSPKFQELAPLLNKFPYGFKIQYSEKQHEYVLIAKEEYLLSDDPIDLSKDPFASKPH